MIFLYKLINYILNNIIIIEDDLKLQKIKTTKRVCDIYMLNL